MMLTLFSLGLNGQNILDLWEGNAPFNRDGIVTEEINENYRIWKVSVPQLYHVGAETSQGELKPAIIIVPGGGYARQAFDHEGLMVAEWFAERGFESFVLKYRLPDQEIVSNPSYVPLMDAQQAVYYVRSHAEKFHIKPDRIGVIGFSAGGHLAASASTLFTDPVNKELKAEDIRPDFSILIYPVISMDDQWTHAGSKTNLLGTHPTDEMVEYFSLENQVSENTPVTLLVHSMDDQAVVVENSLLYAENLYQKGGDVTKIILPEGGHGFGFRKTGNVAYWTEFLEVWLKHRIGDEVDRH